MSKNTVAPRTHDRTPSIGAYRSLMPPSTPRASWTRLRPIWESRNDVLAHVFGDPTNTDRRRWVAQLRARTPRLDLCLDRRDLDEYAFVVAGDTGEGDASQYAVIPPLCAVGQDTSFLIVASDVVYPAGGAAEYENKFYRPFSSYTWPIYATPGNHDWYDGLTGFMAHFCNETTPPRSAVDDHAPPFAFRHHVRRLLWHRPPPFDPAAHPRLSESNR
jgi:hypothetical protein